MIGGIQLKLQAAHCINTFINCRSVLFYYCAFPGLQPLGALITTLHHLASTFHSSLTLANKSEWIIKLCNEEVMRVNMRTHCQGLWWWWCSQSGDVVLHLLALNDVELYCDTVTVVIELLCCSTMVVSTVKCFVCVWKWVHMCVYVFIWYVCVRTYGFSH